jgi:hypothetical protein
MYVHAHMFTRLAAAANKTQKNKQMAQSDDAQAACRRKTGTQPAALTCPHADWSQESSTVASHTTGGQTLPCHPFQQLRSGSSYTGLRCIHSSCCQQKDATQVAQHQVKKLQTSNAP